MGAATSHVLTRSYDVWLAQRDRPASSVIYSAHCVVIFPVNCRSTAVPRGGLIYEDTSHGHVLNGHLSSLETASHAFDVRTYYTSAVSYDSG